MSEDRLTRMEDKIDKLSEAVLAIARMEERMLTVFNQQRVQCVQNIMRIHFGSHCHAERFTGIFI